MKKDGRSQFVIRKYVMAHSAQEAIKLDRKTPVHAVWIDDDWVKEKTSKLQPAIGFDVDKN